MEKCKYKGFEFLSERYGMYGECNLIIDKMIQAINEVPTNDYYIEYLADNLRDVVHKDGIKWSNLSEFGWGYVNQLYCFRLYMHYAMLMAKYNMHANKHILIDALRRFGGDYGYGGDNIRKLSKWDYYLRQYIRLYGPFDKEIAHLID